MYLFDVQKISTKGGSLRGYVCHYQKNLKPSKRLNSILKMEGNIAQMRKKIFNFQKFLYKQKNLINNFINNLKLKKMQIAGYGASVGSTTFLHFFNIGRKIDFLIDDNKFKNLKFSPGYNLIVKNKKQVKSKKNLAILIISWRYARIIKKSIKKTLFKNKIQLYEIFPIISKIYEK